MRRAKSQVESESRDEEQRVENKEPRAESRMRSESREGDGRILAVSE